MIMNYGNRVLHYIRPVFHFLGYYLMINILVFLSLLISLFTNTHSYRRFLNSIFKSFNLNEILSKDLLFTIHAALFILVIFTIFLIILLFSRQRQGKTFRLKYHISLFLLALIIPYSIFHITTKLVGRDINVHDDLVADPLDAYWIPSLTKQLHCNLIASKAQLNDFTYFYYPKQASTQDIKLISADQPIILFFKPGVSNTNRSYLYYNGERYDWGNGYTFESFFAKNGNIDFIISENSEATMNYEDKDKLVRETTLGLFKGNQFITNNYWTPENMKSSFNDINMNDIENELLSIKSNSKWYPGEYELHINYTNNLRNGCFLKHVIKFEVK